MFARPFSKIYPFFLLLKWTRLPEETCFQPSLLCARDRGIEVSFAAACIANSVDVEMRVHSATIPAAGR
jgi:hypothetical protein